MNEITNPVPNPRPVTPFPGDVDGVLRAFFRAEMPGAWPVPAPPPVARDTARPRAELRTASVRGGLRRRAATLVRSRWALAATILLLLFGHTLLSRVFPETAPPDLDPTATPYIGKGPERVNKSAPNRTKLQTPPADHPAQPSPGR